jgi:hypothetical protein
MIHMFASGTGNATRTVIGHSPAFDEWGLTYNDATDTFIFSQTIGGDPSLSIDMNAGPGGTTGYVGIGTVTPSTKLNIVGGTDASLTAGTGSVQIGLGTTTNLAIDSNEVQVRNGAGAAASLFLNAQGGNVFVGSGGTSLVGLGTTAPERLLHVFGGSAGVVTSNANSLAVFEDNVNGYISLLTPATLESGILFGNPGNNADGGIVYVGSIDEMQFRTNGNVTRMVLQGDGRVGIGDISPDAALDVTIANQQVGEFDRTGSDGVLIQFQQAGLVEGSISVTGTTVSYNSFTGSHLALTEEKIERGELVSFTGENKEYHGLPGHEPLYGVKRTAKANDPAVLGAYLGILETQQPYGLSNPYQVMAVGNGDMWVIDTGTNLEPGDYLISSDVPGCAMKDDSVKYPIGHVVAKAAQKVDWSTVKPEADGVRRAKVSVLFGAFARTTAATLPQDQMATLIVLQQQQIQELEARLKAFEAAR